MAHLGRRPWPPGLAGPLLGVVHLLPLPGSPRAGASLADVAERAVQDGRALLQGGVDGLVVENYGDAPFAAEAVQPWVIAAMTRIVDRIQRELSPGLLAVNTLRNDARASLGIAACTGADLIRVNVHTGAMVTDQGVIAGKARQTLLARRRLGCDVRIAADVHVKHAVPLGPQELSTAAADCYTRGLADVLLVTGRGTGQPVDRAAIEALRQGAPEAPLWVASGLNPDNAVELAGRTDGAIVGTWTHAGGDCAAPVAVERVRAVARAWRAGRPSPPGAKMG